VLIGITARFAYGFICIGNVKDGWKDTNFFGCIIMRKVLPIITAAVLGYMIYTSMLTPEYMWFVIIWVVLGLLYAFIVKPKKAVV
jgi:hypothetical protein